jgi:hypothetical protein
MVALVEGAGRGSTRPLWRGAGVDRKGLAPLRRWFDGRASTCVPARAYARDRPLDGRITCANCIYASGGGQSPVRNLPSPILTGRCIGCGRALTTSCLRKRIDAATTFETDVENSSPQPATKPGGHFCAFTNRRNLRATTSAPRNVNFRDQRNLMPLVGNQAATGGNALGVGCARPRDNGSLFRSRFWNERPPAGFKIPAKRPRCDAA